MRRILALMLAILFLSTGVLASEKSDTVFDDIAKSDIYAAVFEADIKSLREAMDHGLITSRELTQIYLDRIDSFGGAKKCFITLCADALDEAEKRDAAIADGSAEGMLFGIPVVVKDNIEYAGYPTTNGYKKDGSVSETNAVIVQYLLDEGAVILGKTNMSTAAQDARVTISKAVGETTNAYDFGMAAGGSSGGTAVAVSLNLAAAGLGTDTNSSLRYPAALNGCVSLRSTFDLVSREGVIKLNGKRDVAGVISRNVYDQAIILDAITGGIYNFAKRLDSDSLKGARLGVIRQLSYPMNATGRTESDFDQEIASAFKNALEELKACGAEIIEVSMPKIFTMSASCNEKYSNAETAKETFYSAYKALFDDNDLTAVIFPSYITAPLYTGVTADGGLNVNLQTRTTNVAIIAPQLGIPEITVQIGLHSRNAGMGLEIAGLRDDDQKLLDLAYSYTLRYDHREVPEYAENLYGTARYTMRQIVDKYVELSAQQTSDTSQSSATPTEKNSETAASTPSESNPSKKGIRFDLIIIITLAVCILIYVILMARAEYIRSRRCSKRRRRYRR